MHVELSSYLSEFKFPFTLAHRSLRMPAKYLAPLHAAPEVITELVHPKSACERYANIARFTWRLF
jgi:hypothetical protein